MTDGYNFYEASGEVTLSKSPSGYVLKFISGKYQGGEFPIEMETEIIIGRSSELSMVLVEDMVSRQHSRITTFNDELIIEDLGSTNGTFVNGEKITQKRLKIGDRILVGTSIIKLVTADEEDGLGPDIRDLPEEAYQNSPDYYRGANNTRSEGNQNSISGMIEEVPLPDLLQLFSTSRKSGVLVIQQRKQHAEIFLREGRVYFTRLSGSPDISAFKAFYRLLAWDHGQFALEQPSTDTFEEEIDASTESLLMEGMRQLDEIANLGTIPKMSEQIQISQPLLPPLRALTPELLDTMQLVHNCTTVETILNTSLASDLETLQDIAYLLKHEYIFSS